MRSASASSARSRRRRSTNDYKLHEWWFGTPPPNSNTSGIVAANENLLFTGLQLAGPDLTLENFSAGLRGQKPCRRSRRTACAPIYSYGKHGVWPGIDYGGLDNLNLIWWDPTAKGEDETGTDGTGLYRFIDNGRRFLPGHYPSDPIKFFDPADTITDFKNVPDELQGQGLPAAREMTG